MAEAGGFDHNAHTLRLLTWLEQPYPRHRGLNLSWETLEGLAKHNGPIHRASWALAEANKAFPLDLASWPSLEAQVAAIADDIAYDNHDIDDGLRAGLFTLDALLAVPFVARSWEGVRRRFPEVAETRLLPELVRDQIGRMVNDVLVESRSRIGAARVRTIDEVRAASGPLIGFSPAMAAEERALKAFLYQYMYHAPALREISDEARALIARLFEAYRSTPELLPHAWRPQGGGDETLLRAIGDYIAGMTDRYAISQHRQLVGDVRLPEGF